MGGGAALALSVHQARQQLQQLLSAAATSEEEGGGAAAAAAAQAAAVALGNPVALGAAGLTPSAPEKQILVHLWAGDVRSALQVRSSIRLRRTLCVAPAGLSPNGRGVACPEGKERCGSMSRRPAMLVWVRERGCQGVAWVDLLCRWLWSTTC